VIFCQAAYCRVTLTANTHNRDLVFGRASVPGGPLVPEIIFLSSASANPNTSMDIRLAEKQCRFPDASGKMLTLAYDAKAIEQWLNVQGFGDPRVADRAQDICDALAEIGTPAGCGFSSFAKDFSSGNQPSPVIAHPTFAYTRPQFNELTYASAIAVALLFWGAGVPLVLRRPRPGRGTHRTPVLATSNARQAPLPQ
jgi:hypothetical protein